MAKLNYLVSIDLNQNEIMQAVLQNVAVFPTAPVAGQLVYYTVDNKPYYYNGTIWIDMYGGIEQITADGGLTFTSGTGTDAIVHLEVDVDNTTIELSTTGVDGQVRIKDLGVSTSKIADSAVTYGKIQQVGILKILGNKEDVAGVCEEIPIIIGVTDPAAGRSIPTLVKVQDLISSAITALGTLVGDFTPTGAYPTTGSGVSNAIVKGDYYYIIAAGTLSANVTVNIGDVLYAKVDAATNSDTDWFVVESNRGQATETVLGVAKIATQAEADAGTNDTDYITPLKLATYVANAGGIFNSHKKTFVVTGDATTVNFPLVHNLGTFYIETNIIDGTTYEKVYIKEVRTDANTLTLSFNTAPVLNKEYWITVIG